MPSSTLSITASHHHRVVRRNVSSSSSLDDVHESSRTHRKLPPPLGMNNNATTIATATTKCRARRILSVVAGLVVLSYFALTIYTTRSLGWGMMDRDTTDVTSSFAKHHQRLKEPLTPPSSSSSSLTSGVTLPGFSAIYQRARQHSKLCTDLSSSQPFDTRSILPFHNDTVASLPAFGIVTAIQNYHATRLDPGTHTDRTTTTTATTATRRRRRLALETDPHTTASPHAAWPTCEMPPTTECEETQLSVVFMAYNPDRLGITLAEIRRMFNPTIFFGLVKEVILVWNGERQIDESEDGRAFLADVVTHPIRIVYPLKMGFPNDLMNRYHPQVVQPTTKAMLYYDDDGPFYTYPAILGGFELWKRHAQAQIGAMARQIVYSPRQQEYKVSLLGAETAKKTKPADNVFVSHCTNVNDTVDYEFHFFANYDANMVLPSGSMLHANYLCYLWHPIFSEIRQFVLLHPVHPDDMTVSMIVSQLAGVAPRVYSRRLDRVQPKKGRQLTEWYRAENHTSKHDSENSVVDEPSDMGIVPLSEQQRHRSLMFSICWDCGAGMTEMKQYWAELRTEAVNALVRYFGSINSGSIGWCTTDSEYYNVNKDGRCWPTMAKQGMLPWMNSDGTPKATCP